MRWVTFIETRGFSRQYQDADSFDFALAMHVCRRTLPTIGNAIPGDFCFEDVRDTTVDDLVASLVETRAYADLLVSGILSFKILSTPFDSISPQNL